MGGVGSQITVVLTLVVSGVVSVAERVMIFEPGTSETVAVQFPPASGPVIANGPFAEFVPVKVARVAGKVAETTPPRLTLFCLVTKGFVAGRVITIAGAFVL